MFFNPATPESSGKMLCADVHRAQQTDTVKKMLQLQAKKKILVNVPLGCTSKVQPLDVSINKPFKDYMCVQFEKHRNENLKLYLENKLTASQRRVLITKWAADVWEKVKANKEMIIRSFNKCGITTAVDGSEDDQVNVEGIEYVMPQPEEEFHLESSSEEDQGDDSGSSSYDVLSSESDSSAEN